MLSTHSSGKRGLTIRDGVGTVAVSDVGGTGDSGLFGIGRFAAVLGFFLIINHFLHTRGRIKFIHLAPNVAVCGLVPTVVENRGGSDSLSLIGVLETSYQKGTAMKGNYRKKDRRSSGIRRPAYRVEVAPGESSDPGPRMRIELPLGELAGDLRAAVNELAGQSGLRLMQALIAEEVEQRAGRRYEHQAVREVHRPP